MDKIRKLEKERRLRNTLWMTAIFALLIIWAIIVLFPFYWMLLTSVKSYASYNAEYIPQFFTLSPTLENYFLAFTAVPPYLAALVINKHPYYIIKKVNTFHNYSGFSGFL